MTRVRGFTLLEVLVAVAVVGIALLAMLTASAHYSRQSFELRERTVAHWVALDRLAAYRLEAGLPDTGVERGETVQLDERWSWSAVINEAPGEAGLRRIDVHVARAGTPDETIFILTGFVGP